MTNGKRKKKVIAISEFVPEKNVPVILDTNILIRLFTAYSIAGTNTYDELLAKLIKYQSKLLISSVQISEMINRCIRIAYDLYKEKNHKPDLNYKKEYRSTDDYKEKMEDILHIITQDIVPNFEFIDDGFSKMPLDNIFKIGFSYDFNDALLVEIVKLNKAVLVTEDMDFANYKMDFPIVTSNRLLLSMEY